MKKVLIVGDSRKMKGGVSTVIKAMEAHSIWKKWHCYWLQCQVNKSIAWKLMYLCMGLVNAFVRVPFYDIIHFHTTPGTGMKVVLPIYLYAMLWRKKIVTHLHMGNQIRDHKDDKLFRWVMEHSDKVIMLGKIWKDYVDNEMKVKADVDFLYNPVGSLSPNPSSLTTKHSTLPPKQKYFLFAAWFDLNKGYDILFEAFAKVIKVYPDWKLVLCGTGKVEELMGYLHKNEIEKNVELPGWVEGEVRERYFKEAYAYCMTSYQEGLPLSVLECLAIGVPVISTPVGCLPEFLEDEKNVLFFDFGNSEKLAEQMMKLIEDAELHKNLSQNGIEVIEQSFTSDRVFEKLNRIYEELSC